MCWLVALQVQLLSELKLLDIKDIGNSPFSCCSSLSVNGQAWCFSLLAWHRPAAFKLLLVSQQPAPNTGLISVHATFSACYPTASSVHTSYLKRPTEFLIRVYSNTAAIFRYPWILYYGKIPRPNQQHNANTNKLKRMCLSSNEALFRN